MVKKKIKYHRRKKENDIKREGSTHNTLIASAIIAALFLILAIYYSNSIHSNNLNSSSGNSITNALGSNTINYTKIQQEVLPKTGDTLRFKWGDSVRRLVQSGAISLSNISIILNNSHQPLTLAEREILNGTYNGYIQINSTNTQFTVLVLWALGINNNNTIINNGPIMKASASYSNQMNSNTTPYIVASKSFASTGGYGPIGKLQLGQLNIVSLTPSEQIFANFTAYNSYRPCCNNPTAFPDCNHGAAALGLIELLASQGANQTEIFSAVRDFNSFQFPQQYIEAAAYLESQGKSYNQTSPQELVGLNFSSITGFLKVNQYLANNGILKQLKSNSPSCSAYSGITSGSTCNSSISCTSCSDINQCGGSQCCGGISCVVQGTNKAL